MRILSPILQGGWGSKENENVNYKEHRLTDESYYWTFMIPVTQNIGSTFIDNSVAIRILTTVYFYSVILCHFFVDLKLLSNQ